MSWVWPGFARQTAAAALRTLDLALNRLERALYTPERIRSTIYGTTVTPDAGRGRRVHFQVVPTDGVAFTIAAPVGAANGTLLTFDIVNNTGGALGAIAWDAYYVFLTAFTAPATGSRATVSFYCGDAAAVQIAHEPAGGGGGGGEANTASNVGTAGTGIWDAKVGVDLQFRKLNGNAKVTATLDAPNKKIDLDVVESALALGSIGGSLALGQIPNALITPAKLADLAAVSLLGRSANSAGVMAAIAAGANDRLMARVGDALAFTQLTAGMVPNDLVTYALLQNISATQRLLGRNTAGAGDPEEVTASQVLDWIGSTRGSILYRGASGWAALAPGTATHVLTSNGAGADPSYQAAGGGSSPWTIVKKTADQNRSAVTGAAADSALTIALSASTRYVIRGSVRMQTANATMDFKVAFGYTGTTTTVRGWRRTSPAGAAAGTDNENTVPGAALATLAGNATATTSGVGYCEFEIEILTNTAGTFSFDWAQVTSDAGNLTCCAGSYLEYATF